jgi:hypothetical protein
MVVTWDEVATGAQIVEAVVVVFSVVFIWLQLRQQTKLAKVANTQTLFELSSPLNMQVIQDREFATLIFDGHKSYDSLEEVDKFRYRGTLTWRLSFHKLAYYQHQNGLLDNSVYKSWEDDFKTFVDRRHLKLRWAELKPFYPEDFSRYVTNIIEIVESERARRNLLDGHS